MKKLTEKEFFEDVLAILTLPSESVTVLILGEKGTLEPQRFLDDFIRKFISLTGSIAFSTSGNKNFYKVEKYVNIVLSTDRKMLHDKWDYEIILGHSWQEVEVYTAKTGNVLSRQVYKLSKELTELLIW